VGVVVAAVVLLLAKLLAEVLDSRDTVVEMFQIIAVTPRVVVVVLAGSEILIQQQLLDLAV